MHDNSYSINVGPKESDLYNQLLFTNLFSNISSSGQYQQFDTFNTTTETGSWSPNIY
jgi:hypothetical protein